MSSSISGLAAANVISTPTGLLGNPSSTEFQAAAGNQNLQVDGDTIDTGRYLIIASTASTHGAGASSVDDGQVTIYDKQTNTYVNVWGDPHLTASDGNKADFQKDGLTINLADGTQVEFSPTALSNGVAHIQDLAVTKNGQTVGVTNFEGQAGTSPTVSGILQGPASTYNSSLDNGNDTILTAGSTDIGALTFADGDALNSTGSQMDLDGIGGGIAEYCGISNNAAASSASSSVASATNAGSTGTAQQATSSMVLPSDIPSLISKLENAVSSSTTLTPAQQMQAMKDLVTISTAVAATPAPISEGNLSTVDQMLNSITGSSQFAVAPTVTEVPDATTVSGMLSQIASVAQTLPANAQSAVSDLTTLLTLPPPVVTTPLQIVSTPLPVPPPVGGSSGSFEIPLPVSRSFPIPQPVGGPSGPIELPLPIAMPSPISLPVGGPSRPIELPLQTTGSFSIPLPSGVTANTALGQAIMGAGEELAQMQVSSGGSQLPISMPSGVTANSYLGKAIEAANSDLAQMRASDSTSQLSGTMDIPASGTSFPSGGAVIAAELPTVATSANQPASSSNQTT